MRLLSFIDLLGFGRNRAPEDFSRWMAPVDVVKAYTDRDWTLDVAKRAAPLKITKSEDGDSGDCEVRLDPPIYGRWRMSGPDCLEKQQPLFWFGRDWFNTNVVGREIFGLTYGIDVNGRQLVELFRMVNGKLIAVGEEMIGEGLALLYDLLRPEGHLLQRPLAKDASAGSRSSILLPESKTAYAQHLQGLEDNARRQGKGIWSPEWTKNRNRPFVLPWDFRRGGNLTWMDRFHQRGLDPYGPI